MRVHVRQPTTPLSARRARWGVQGARGKRPRRDGMATTGDRGELRIGFVVRLLRLLRYLQCKTRSGPSTPLQTLTCINLEDDGDFQAVNMMYIRCLDRHGRTPPCTTRRFNQPPKFYRRLHAMQDKVHPWIMRDVCLYLRTVQHVYNSEGTCR